MFLFFLSCSSFHQDRTNTNSILFLFFFFNLIFGLHLNLFNQFWSYNPFSLFFFVFFSFLLNLSLSLSFSFFLSFSQTKKKKKNCSKQKTKKKTKKRKRKWLMWQHLIGNWIFFFFFGKESGKWKKKRKTEREKKEIKKKEELKGLERYMIDCLIYQWTFLFHISSECFSLLFFFFFFIHKLLKTIPSDQSFHFSTHNQKKELRKSKKNKRFLF